MNGFFHGVGRFIVTLLCSSALLGTMSAQAGDNLVAPWGTEWRYLDNGSDQGVAWRQPGFDDSSWSAGVTRFGYGYGGEATIINSGPVGNGFITSYYRREFNVLDPAHYTDLTLAMLVDDGAIVYVNGVEVFRENLPAGTIAYNTVATNEMGTVAPGPYVFASVPSATLHAGTNTITVEVHQASTTSPGAAFALALLGNYPQEQPGIFARGPYLQMVTPTSAIIRWGTITDTDSVVHFGITPGSLTQTVSDATSTHHHEVHLTGLAPATTYYYSVGSSTAVFSSGTDHFFKTQPVVGAVTPTRLWVIGDSGKSGRNAGDVYNAYRNYTGSRYTDLWLMLGDNAYDNGTDQEYQDNLFNVYPGLLRQTAVWPTLGNHDGASVNTPLQTGVYYNNFTLPTAAEAGGVASGTEAYYSYDYGNMHFVVLDSFDVDRSATGAMATWLQNDLAATTADWVIAYWHHPPYSKGSHNSDDNVHDPELVQMRENILPILEAHGVDLVLSGHSHSYERSKFVQGHYGYSNTYSDSLFALDIGSGNPALGAPAYTKAHPAVARGGTVYAVVGVSARFQPMDAFHPVMYRSLDSAGSMVIDVDNLALTARFINENGVVKDGFTIQKLNTGSDRDGDSIANTSDNCPVNANADQQDSDSDGAGNVCDTDDDNDGVTDGLDAFPLDASETGDHDQDGVGDNADIDDDNDGIPDYIDADPLDAANHVEKILPLGGSYKGSKIGDRQQMK